MNVLFGSFSAGYDAMLSTDSLCETCTGSCGDVLETTVGPCSVCEAVCRASCWDDCSNTCIAAAANACGNTCGSGCAYSCTSHCTGTCKQTCYVSSF